MTKDFTELDIAIITRIRAGFTRFYEIWPACTQIVNGNRTKVDRAVDRRLQALKKQGKIICRGQRWYLTDGLPDIHRST